MLSSQAAPPSPHSTLLVLSPKGATAARSGANLLDPAMAGILDLGRAGLRTDAAAARRSATAPNLGLMGTAVFSEPDSTCRG